MSYHLSIEKATEIADRAVSHMHEHKIPATPDNFTIWFEYAAGANPPLSNILDKLIKSDRKIDEKISRDIYEKHVSVANKSTNSDMQVETIAEQLLDALKQAGEDTGQYESRLQSFSGTLDNASDAGEVRILLDEMVADTKSMTAHTSKLQNQLHSSRSEIATLKDELQSARQDSMTDGLTGLANRRAFDQYLEQAIAKSMEANTPLALIMSDLDHFKSFNDKFGHTVGDQVLRIVGSALNRRVKGEDIAARYGGEEFAIILPKTSIGGAAAVADDIRATVASKKLVKKDGKADYGVITMSLGTTCYLPGEPINEFIERADSALYEAKKFGRNRVMAREAPGPLTRAQAKVSSSA